MAYSQEDKIVLAEKIAELMLDMSVEDACDKVGLGHSTFWRWLAADKDVWEYYAHAREVLALKGESEIEKINRDLRNTVLEPQQARVMADNVKWLMGRRNPKVYGEKATIAHEGGEKPIEHKHTVADIAEAAALYKRKLEGIE